MRRSACSTKRSDRARATLEPYQSCFAVLADNSALLQMRTLDLHSVALGQPNSCTAANSGG